MFAMHPRSTARRQRIPAFGLAVVLVVLAAARPGWANVYMVSNTNDSGAGSLRKAINDANGHAGPDEIKFNLGEDKNGTLTDGLGEALIFDDDAAGPAGLCAAGTTIARPKITIAGLGDQPGNERLSFKGRLKFAAGAPAGMTPLDAVGHGAQLLIEDLGSGGAAIFDLTADSDPVPPGALGPACAAGQTDGWGVNAASTIYTYRNVSGALAPGCTPGSAHGLKAFKLIDRRSSKQRVLFNVRTKATTIATPVGPLRATIVLGSEAADGFAGRCGSHAFDALDCALDPTGTKLNCQ